MKKTLFIFFAIIGTAHFAMGQEPSLWLGGMEMRIGMPQASVINHLSKHYDLQELTGPDSLLIFEKKSSPQDQIQNIGQVAFDKGKLIYVVKEWHFEDIGRSDKLVDVLHAVLEQMEGRGETVATIETVRTREPDTIRQAIKLSFGKRWITISSLRFKDLRTVQVTETIRFAPFPK